MGKLGITDPLVNFLYDLRERGLEFVSGRYYGTYGGNVTDTKDPQGQGRVLVECPVATGREDPLSIWAYPSGEFGGNNKGSFFPPDEGDPVWVWFDHGDVTQPRYSGSWWPNPADDPTPATSQVPAEFQTASGIPTRRGVKTKRGHGWFFEDDTTSGARFELWTGEPANADNTGVAVRHHQFILSDLSGAESITVASKGGQTTKWIDIAGKLSITNTTKNGFFANLLDYANKIQMGGPKGFTFTIDEAGQQILLDTPKGFFAHIMEQISQIKLAGPLGYSFTIDEATGAVTSLTPAGRTVSLSDTAQSIIVSDGQNSITMAPVGVSLISAALMSAAAAAAMTLTAGGAMTVTSGGPMALTGAGLALISGGGGPSSTYSSGVTNNTFVGLKTEELLGGLVQSLVGAWIMTVIGEVAIISPVIQLGSGAKFALVDERFLTMFNTHSHFNTTLLGAPTGPPISPIPSGVANTINVTAS